MKPKVIFQSLGLIDYQEAWDYQEKLFKDTIDKKIRIRNGETDLSTQNYLLFCEHPHVYTLGKSGDASHLLLSEELLAQHQAKFYKINRGGDITYHGPGQLVAYPIIDLESFGIGVKKYISMLEDVVIEVLDAYGIKGEKDEKAMGVWIDPGNPALARKICAIGVRTSRYVTMHGLALNVNTDLSYFSFINPCGFTDKATTSMQKELGREVDFEEVSDRMKTAFYKVFNLSA